MGSKILVKNGLKAYVGYSRAGGTEAGACLIFAHNTKEAHKLAYKQLGSWFDSNGPDDWIDIATKVLAKEFLFKEADQEKLAVSIAHVIDCPETCHSCELWGKELDEKGFCEDCCEGNLMEE